MKPKDLKIPFTWDERHPLLTGNLFYVPEFCTKTFTLPPLKELFVNNYPISIEYCSGNGEWIAHKAKAHPDRNWIAVEKQFPRVRKIWSKSQNYKLNNLFVVCGLAQDFTHYLTTPCIDTFYVNFPDPWPKNRHAKHRLIQAPFIDMLTRAALPGAQAEFVTDDLPYAEQMLTVMSDHLSWNPQMHILDESHGPSFFDRLWRDKNRAIHKVTSTYA